MRKTKIVQVPKFSQGDNRDINKTFLITEWPAARADRWIQELMLAANRGAGEIPMDLRGIGWEGIAVMGINTFLRGSGDGPRMIELGEQLLECVKIIRDPKHPDVATEIVVDDDVQEIVTRWWLRDQVVSVHVNFSPLDALSRLMSSIMQQAPEPSPAPISKNTRTSRRESATSSPGTRG